MANLSGYAVGGSAQASGVSTSTQNERPGEYWPLEKLKRTYLDYLGTKREEIDEQQDARRVRHGSQWTHEQIKQLNARKQPIITNNKIARKIHGIVGTLARLKQDPKAYPRTPEHEKGAELATAVLRYVLDQQNFAAIDTQCAEQAAIDGIGGLEINLIPGDQGDPEIELEYIIGDSFFYDPRSFRQDFSDARFMGVGKWLDMEAAVEMFPEHKEELEASLESGSELTTDADRENKWFQNDGDVRRVRVVEEWYRHNGKWCWCFYTGALKLKEGQSYFVDEKGESISKYVIFSAYVDQDGDRYGFIRDLKPLQVEINMRRSKALYTMLARRIIAPRGAFEDVELARREAARTDGVVEYNVQGDAKPEFDDTARMAETEAQFKFLEDVKSDFESYGPNIAILGEGLENSSGRAIHLLQQAGLADLGPFIQSYRGWKIRAYRAVWNAVQKHWSGERWIRVTDDDEISEFIHLNGVENDPATGMPIMVNAVGSLDVDIILDEGPDSVNLMADAYDTLTVLASKGAEIPPDVLIELAPLPVSLKQKILEKMNPQPSPEQQQRAQIETQMGVETVKEKAASAELKQAQAIKALSEASQPPEQAQIQLPDPGDPPIKTITEAEEKAASARLKDAQAAKTWQDIALEPQRMAQEAEDAERKFEFDKLRATQKPKAE